MVKIVYGLYKEVIKLISKFRELSKKPFLSYKWCFKILLDMGLNTASIISDNNAINVKVCKSFCITGSNCLYIHTLLNRKFFFMFDLVQACSTAGTRATGGPQPFFSNYFLTELLFNTGLRKNILKKISKKL